MGGDPGSELEGGVFKWGVLINIGGWSFFGALFWLSKPNYLKNLDSVGQSDQEASETPAAD